MTPENSVRSLQWQLMSLRFRRHRLAVWSGFLVLAFYLVALFCEFLAPYTLTARDIEYLYAPPQPVRFIGPDGLHLRPFVYGLKGMRQSPDSPKALHRGHEPDLSGAILCRGVHPIVCGACSKRISIYLASTPGALSFFSVPIRWAATCSRGSFTEPVSPSPSAWSGWCSPSFSAFS